MNKQLSKNGRTVLLAVLSVLYIAGIIALFFNTALGLVLWAAALIPSLVMYLYGKRRELMATEEKAEELAREAEAEAKEDTVNKE